MLEPLTTFSSLLASVHGSKEDNRRERREKRREEKRGKKRQGTRREWKRHQHGIVQGNVKRRCSVGFPEGVESREHKERRGEEEKG